MTLCPIAIVASCKKCPIFGVCPVKGIIGDFKPEAPAKKGTASSGKGGTKKSK
jgi:hypothetical protein